MTDEVKPTSIRIPNSLREKLKKLAKENNRSVNNMIEVLLLEATKHIKCSE